MHSLDDTARAFKESLPRVKIRKIDVLDPEVQTAKQRDAGWRRKMKDERKRSLDEVGHAGKVRDRDRSFGVKGVVGVLRPVESIAVPDIAPSGRRYILRLYRTRDGEISCWKWVDPRNIPWAVGEVNFQRVLYLALGKHGAAGVERPPYPTVMVPACDLQGWNARRAKTNGGRLREACGEVVSESLVPPPGRGVDHIARRWRADGRLQVRDMGGVPQEVAVFTSRRHMDDSMREFNRNSPDVQLRNSWTGEKARGAGRGRFDR